MPKSYLIDMDGVLLSGSTIIPGADRFIERLKARGAEYLVLTNNSMYTPGDLAHRFQSIGLDVPLERIFTSASNPATGWTPMCSPASRVGWRRSSC
jgi:NagD protein